MAATEEIRRKYTLEFKILNMAEKDVKNIVSLFGRHFGAIGKIIGDVVTAIGGHFGKLAAFAMHVINTITLGFLGMSQAAKIIYAVFGRVIELVKEAINIGTTWQNSITIASVAGKIASQTFEELSLRVGDLGVGAREAARGFEVLVRAGLSGKDAVAVFTDLALFSRAIGEDMRKTSQLLVGAMAAFGKKASDAADVLKVFSYAILRTRFNFETFSTAFAFGGAALAGFGQDLTETVAIMTKFFDMGLRASTVGTTLRNMVTRLAKPTREAQIALAQYGIAIENVNPAANKLKDILITLIPLQGDLAAATTLFGRRTAGFIVNLLKELTKNGKAIEEVINNIRDSGDLLTEAMQRRLQTLAGQMERMGALWENFRIDVFRSVEPVVRVLAIDLGDAISELRDNFRSAAPYITSFLMSMKSLFDVLVTGPLLGAIDAIALAIDMWTGGLLSLSPEIMSNSSLIGKMSVIIKKAALAASFLALSFRILLTTMKDLPSIILTKVFGDGADAAKMMADSVGKDKGLTLEIVNLIAALKDLPMRMDEGFTPTSIERLKREARDTIAAMNALGQKMEAAPKGASKEFLKMTALTGKLLIELKKASSEGLGSFTKKIDEIRQKFGPALADLFKSAGMEFARGRNITDMIKIIRDKMRTEESVLGIFFGQGPGDRNKIIRDAVVLGEDVMTKVGMTLEKRPSVVVDALIGTKKVSPEQRRMVSTLVGRIFADFFRDTEKFRKEFGDMLPDEEIIRGSIGSLQYGLEKVVPAVDELLRSFTKMDTASQQVFETWRKFDATLATKLIEHLEGMKKTADPGAWLDFARNLKLAGAEVTKADVSIQKLSDVFRTRFTKELKDALVNLKESPAAVRDVAKAINEKAIAVLKAEQAWKSLDQGLRAEVMATFQELTAGMPVEQIKAMSRELIEAAKAETEWNKAMVARQTQVDKAAGAFKETYKYMFGTLHAQLITDAQIREMQWFNHWVQQLNRGKNLWNEYVTYQQAIYNAWLYSMSAEMRKTTGAMFDGLKRAISAVARAFVDSSFDLKKNLRQIAKDVLAMLLEIIIQATVVKAIFKGIWGAERGGGIFFNLFGFQKGTSLAGVQGPGGIDNIPALLTKGEIVLDKNASDAFRDMMGGGGRPVGNTNIFEIHAMDGADVERVVKRKVVPLLNRQLRTNTGIAPDVRMRAAKTTFQKGLR